MRKMNFNHILTDEEVSQQSARIESYGGVVIAVENCEAEGTTSILFMP